LLLFDENLSREFENRGLISESIRRTSDEFCT
jgi:hypothetical protein